MSQEAHATGEVSSEQVVVSPTWQAMNNAIQTATTEVTQADTASTTAATTVTTASTQITEAVTAVAAVTTEVTNAQTAITQLTDAITSVETADPTTTNQSSPVVTAAQSVVTSAQTAVDNAEAAITAATTELNQATTARTAITTALATAQTELTQANTALDAAQTAVNNLQATIATTNNVLAGVDDAGVRMNLPFGMLMGGTLYNDVYVGSNATITFGTNEGWVYYTTPGAPSVSIGGYDWTTWSQGSGITYSTTGTSLDIAWDLRVYPLMDMSTQMTQIRFNADVNPTSGAWVANVAVTGPIPNGARFNVRETANGALTPIVDTNAGAGFTGQIGQGTYVAPAVDPNANNAVIQAAIDSANATIAQLNSTIGTVVARNTATSQARQALPSTTSLSTTLTNASVIVEGLQTSVTTKAAALSTAIGLLPVAQVQELHSAPRYEVDSVDTSDNSTESDTEESSQDPTEESTTPDQGTDESSDETSDSEEQQSEEEQAQEQDNQEQENQSEESQTPPVDETPTVSEVVDDAMEDGVLTEAEKDAVVEALIEAADGEAITAEAIAEAGLEYSDLPPETPVEVRKDENGNEVIITAEVAAALQVLESPAAFIGEIFGCLTPSNVTEQLTEEQKCQVLAALANIGADMSPQEREEATKMVVATVVAAGAAMNAAAVAAGAAGSTGGSTGGGSSKGGGTGGGPAAGGDKPKRTFRRRAK